MEKQKDLFNNEVKEDWEAEWLDMPEFVQENKDVFKKITLNFKTKQAVDDFSKLIGQKITPKTNSLTFPKEDRSLKKLVWEDES